MPLDKNHCKFCNMPHATSDELYAGGCLSCWAKRCKRLESENKRLRKCRHKKK